MLDTPLLRRRTDCPVRDAVDGRRPGRRVERNPGARRPRQLSRNARHPCRSARSGASCSDAYKPAVAAGGAGLVVNLIDNADAGSRHGRSARTSAPMRTCPDGRTQEDASHVADRELRSRRHHRQRSRTVSVTTTEAWPRRWLTMWTGTPAWKLVESNVPTTLNTPAGAGSLRGYSPGW